MAAVPNAPIQITPRTWLLSWSGTPGAGYVVLLNGRSVTPAPTRQTELVVSVDPGSTVWYEVREDGVDAAISGGAFGEGVLSWEHVSGAVSYRVERWTGSAWVFVARIEAEVSGAYSYLTGVLDDVTTYLFRVVAEGGTGPGRDGTEGVGLEFTWLNVRYPDSPGVEIVGYVSGTRVPTFGVVV